MFRVLVACEFSGVVREAFRARGFDAWSCDLLPTEQDGPHIQGDVSAHLCDGWKLMIAHPPCTYFANSGVRHLIDNPERVTKMQEAFGFWAKISGAPIPHIAVENPIPHRYAREFIGDYSQVVQPWMFGHGETKATCLWLKGLPRLRATHADDPGLFFKQAPAERCARVHREPPSPNRWKNRSRTYRGIAEAMADQWGQYVTARVAA